MSREPTTGRQPRSGLERRVVARQAKAPDLMVIEPLNQWTCAGCGGSGSLLLMEDGEPLCMTCADLDHPVFLPAGVPRPLARVQVRAAVDRVLAAWEAPAGTRRGRGTR
jgi:hypothetical protein